MLTWQHKKLREKSWTKTWNGSYPPLVLPVAASEEDFEDAWERISDFGDDDRGLMSLMAGYYKVCIEKT
jgi:hypothetical protein